MNRAKTTAWMMVLGSFVAGLLTLLIPTPPGQAWLNFHLVFCLSVIFGLLQLAAAILFVRGLGSFKPELRIAYGLICAGVVLVGVAQLQAPLLAYFDLGESFWVRGGLVIIPYLAPIILYFVGVRRFVRLLEVKTIWSSAWFAMALALSATTLITLLPHAATPDTEIQFRASMAMGTWSVTFLMVTTVMTFRARRVVGEIYQTPLLWFALATGTMAFAGLDYLAVNMLFGNPSHLLENGVTTFPYVLASLMAVRAGYAFLSISADTPSAPSNRTASLLDIIIYTASLASRPDQIEKIMNPVRTITSSMVPGEPPTREQEQALKRVYREIERYLVETEPIRTFTATQIRRKVIRNFRLNPARSHFWE